MQPQPHTCLGRTRVDHVADGIRIAELDATVPGADVPEHEHDDAHIVLRCCTGLTPAALRRLIAVET